MDIIKIAEYNQQTAWKILKATNIIPLWENIGAKVNIIGSLKSGLLMNSKDIDMHVYTEKLDVVESFSVIQRFAQNFSVKEIQYKNLIDTEEECIEWHALLEDKEMNNWKFDMIHIRKGSKYDGTVERVTDAIIAKLTPNIRKTILQIKHDVPEDTLISGIEIYHAVFTGGVKSYEELQQWRKTNPLTNSLDWLP